MSRPFIPAPNTVSVEFIYSYYAATTMENVIHVAKGAPFTAAQISSLRAALITWWNANIKANAYNSLCLVRVRTKALDSNSAPMEDFTLSPASCGVNAAANGLPGSACLAYKLSTGLAGRSNRGRVYMPLMSTNILNIANTNEVSAAQGAAWNTCWSNLIAAVNSWDATAHWVVTSFRNNGAWRTTAVNNNVTSVVLVDLHVDSQRRRLTGRGI